MRLVPAALIVALALLPACRKDPDDWKPDPVDTGLAESDPDGDGWRSSDGDCDETDPTVHPSAVDDCDGIDTDCDGEVDEDGGATWYTDADGDGYGDSATARVSCDSSGGVSNAEDCDDADPSIHPGADEVCTDPVDRNCDGSVGYADADLDGVAACEDCDDGDAGVHPGADEHCDDRDEDCDGLVDEDPVDPALWYADTDGDGAGGIVEVSACDQPEGFVATADDCDDGDASIHPGAEELCTDPVDRNCDGSTGYADADGDGTAACEDCDDADATAHPGGAEVCDGADNDCDGAVDNGASDAPTWYADTDGDTYGDPGAASASCEAPAGTSANAEDCDDTDASLNPGASESCDGRDEDCDGAIDEDAGPEWWLDADCDGEGGGAAVRACDSPGDDWVSTATDCDDGDTRVSTAGSEVCDGVDEDCDGAADDTCVDSTLIADPSGGDPVEAPATGAACARIGEMPGTWDVHLTANLPSYMAVLDGTSAGLVDAVNESASFLDYSARCGADKTPSVGNFSPTNPWPTLASTSNSGAARFRGYLNIRCGDPLDYTIGLIGNDAVSLSIEGAEIIEQDWTRGEWKKFRYISFPGPGLYAFEVRWQTNLVCEIDPFELVWADGFVPGYGAYDSMCAWSTCTYGDGVAIPGFSVIGGDALVQTTSGDAGSCEQCASDVDCSTGSCNTAGLCE